MNSGIYKIVNTVNGKAYIGSAINFQRRWDLHLSLLRRNMHHNIKLQRSWNKYGETAFAFSVIDRAPADLNLVAVEQKWLDSEAPFYNIARTAGSQLGVKLSDETKRKMSAVRFGKTPSAETRAKMSSWQIGKTVSEETRRKISETKRANGAGKGQVAWNKGIPHTDETRAKMSAWHQASRPRLAA
ncbi:hypothetical protein C7T35_15420 [Variovorax sp. WS11]|nr:hypothetical protein C7T35_15420 [Variovorax sp. WS11]